MVMIHHHQKDHTGKVGLFIVVSQHSQSVSRGTQQWNVCTVI